MHVECELLISPVYKYPQCEYFIKYNCVFIPTVHSSVIYLKIQISVMEFITTTRGGRKLLYKGYAYVMNREAGKYAYA